MKKFLLKWVAPYILPIVAVAGAIAFVYFAANQWQFPAIQWPF